MDQNRDFGFSSYLDWVAQLSSVASFSQFLKERARRQRDYVYMDSVVVQQKNCAGYG